MLVVHVDIQVLPDCVDAFRAASVANAEASNEEPGILRFDLLADEADPAHFMLVEVYRDVAASAAHKETEHYARWRDTVADMMARPRQPTRFARLFPTADE